MGQLMSSELNVQSNGGGYSVRGMKRTAPSGGALDYQPPQRRFVKVAVNSHGGSKHVSLVERVKMLQRRDLESKQSWRNFCNQSSGGILDPARHDADTLKRFLAEHE